MSPEMNRETKRLLQRQGQIGADGQPLATPRQSQPRSAAAIANRPRKRTTPFAYLREVRTELRKVAWPTRAETRNYSTVVLVTLAFMLALIFGLDLGFSKFSEFLFK
jgi:preprotein translocase subunit SecE